jgi:hypothetical protein
MSAIVLEAVRSHTEETDRSPSTGRPHLVLVPTRPEAARAARAARATRAPLRPTRFGRLVVSLLVASSVSLLGVGLAGQLASATGEPRTVMVESGQTLSGIAARELPDLTTAEGVVELQVANGLSATGVHAGQQLVIPTR